MFQGHPHILQLNHSERGVLFPHYDGRKVPVFLVDTELAAGGSLSDLTLELMPFERFDATLCRSYFLQLVSGLQGMHDKGIAHLDLKPDNILLTRESNVLKLADLGLARDTASGKLNSYFGTDQFSAPEVLRFHPNLPECWRGPQPAKPYDGLKADVFSLGCILFYMLASWPPFRGKTDDDKIPPGHQDHYPVGGAHAGDGFFQVQCVRITAQQLNRSVLIALHSCPASPMTIMSCVPQLLSKNPRKFWEGHLSHIKKLPRDNPTHETFAQGFNSPVCQLLTVRAPRDGQHAHIIS